MAQRPALPAAFQPGAFQADAFQRKRMLVVLARLAGRVRVTARRL